MFRRNLNQRQTKTELKQVGYLLFTKLSMFIGSIRLYYKTFQINRIFSWQISYMFITIFPTIFFTIRLLMILKQFLRYISRIKSFRLSFLNNWYNRSKRIINHPSMPHPFIRIIIIINNINGRSSPPYFLIIYEFIILFHLLN